MKKIVFLVLFLAWVCVHAQSFSLYEVINYEEGDEIVNEAILSYTCVEGEEDGNLHAKAETYVILENTSDEDKVVVCKREILQWVDDAETYFCWGTCNGSQVSIDERTVDANTKTGVVDFSTHYTAPLVEGTSIVRYVFYDKENPEDSISVVFEYITPYGLRTPIYVGAMALSVYPNPTVDYLTIEAGNLQLKQASIILYDAVGRKLKTQLLTSHSTKMDVNSLEQGIYYLQIINDNITIGFRKFIKE